MNRRTYTYDVTYDICLHRDDGWIDEILLEDDKSRPVLRLIYLYRYKTSGLSGDEWRVSTMWQVHHRFADMVQGDCDPFRRDANWFNFDGGYGRGLDVGCAALFPGLFSSQPLLHDIPILRVVFERKGRRLYSSSHNNQPLRLFVAAAHLPWAWIDCCDQPTGTDEAWADMRELCFQIGCAEKSVSTYRLKYLYDNNGEKREALGYASLGMQHRKRLVRRFCPLHLRRGDCGLEDADNNYDVVYGPGPDSAMGWEEYRSESQSIILP